MKLRITTKNGGTSIRNGDIIRAKISEPFPEIQEGRIVNLAWYCDIPMVKIIAENRQDCVEVDPTQ